MTVQFRYATDSDARRLFYWRNHPKVRHSSLNSIPIAWSSHRAWLHKTVCSADRLLLIASIPAHHLGVIRFDSLMNQPILELSIFLAPQHLGKGFGLKVLIEGLSWVRQNKPKVERLHAKVLSTNVASKRLFEKAGFSPSHTWKVNQRSGITYVYEFK